MTVETLVSVAEIKTKGSCFGGDNPQTDFLWEVLDGELFFILK